MRSLIDQNLGNAQMAVNADSRSLRTGSGVANGTFGELLQGRLSPQGHDFLVTNPIPLLSRVRFHPVGGVTDLSVRPGHKLKSRELAAALLRRCSEPTGGYVIVDSDIPEGKGLASSSADLVATYRAIADALPSLRVSPETLARLMCDIEPSDGVMYSGHVAFDHRRGALIEKLGPPLAITVVAVDEGGTIDSVEFNRCGLDFGRGEICEYQELINAIAPAIRSHNLAAVGAIATRSAQLSQRRNPKRLLNDLERIAQAAGALGVVVAHSGTMAGVLIDSRQQYTIDGVTAALEMLGCSVTTYRAGDAPEMSHQRNRPELPRLGSAELDEVKLL
jgi:uncharacterized protein involved in propanediol utilization